MDGNGVVAAKKNEVLDIAKKYGVERYIGTDRLAITDVLVATWAEDVAKEDPLTSHSKWVETKSEIEDIIANTALENNSRQSLYLLGAAQTGQVSLNEVKTAYVEGWNTLMAQYSGAIAMMSQSELIDLERHRDRYLATIPDYGAITEKSFHAKAAASSLAESEQILKGYLTNSMVSNARNDLAERETTRSLLLTEAESGMQDGSLTPGQYQQLVSLIGRKDSLYEGQVGTLNRFSNNPGKLMEQIDRTLVKASSIIKNRESRYALMGTHGFVTDPRVQQMNQRLGRTHIAKPTITNGMTGDGIRFVKPEDKIMATMPNMVGQDIAQYSNPPQVMRMNQAPPEATIVSKNNAMHSKFMNPANVNRDHLSSRFSAYHMQRQRLPSTDKAQTIKRYRRSSPAQEAKLAGVYPASRRGLGGGALDTLTTSRPVQMVALGILGWMGVTAIKSFAPSKDDDSPSGARMNMLG
tara:strand:- start:2832 stop:4232 length:1401 start_codon:yes stop_codon:yes gene_type:complete